MNNYAVQDNGHALDWNSTIEHDSEFILLDEGTYDFTVSGFTRARHNGSEKLPPCAKAVITLRIATPKASCGYTELTHNLFLHSKCEGMLCAFFTAIGMRKHGEKLAMDWNKVIGSHGRCEVGVRKWTSNNGNELTSNEIKKFIDPEKYASQNTAQQQTVQGGAFIPGRF